MDTFMNVIYSDVLYKGDAIIVDKETILVGTRELEKPMKNVS